MTIVLAAVLTALTAQAQQADNGKQRGQRQRPTQEQIVDFQCNKLINELYIDESKVAKFTEMYKAYRNEMFEVKQKYHPVKKGEDRNKKQQLTDQEVEQEILNGFAQNRATTDIREKYYKKFRTILTPRQIKKVFMQDRKNQGNMRNEQMRRNGHGNKGFKNRGEGFRGRQQATN